MPDAAKTDKERKRDERAKKREAGLVPVQEWVHREDADRLSRYAARLRRERDRRGVMMQTKEDVAQAFRAELQALLNKYGAELEARDHWQGYAECGEDVRMTVDVPAIYDADHNCIREYTEIDLGKWMCCEKPPVSR